MEFSPNSQQVGLSPWVWAVAPFSAAALGTALFFHATGRFNPIPLEVIRAKTETVSPQETRVHLILTNRSKYTVFGLNAISSCGCTTVGLGSQIQPKQGIPVVLKISRGPEEKKIPIGFEFRSGSRVLAKFKLEDYNQIVSLSSAAIVGEEPCTTPNALPKTLSARSLGLQSLDSSKTK